MRAPLVSRRTLLRGTAGAAIALPWLEAMSPRSPLVWAQPAAATPQRFLTYAQPLSIFAALFWPTPPGKAPFDVENTALPQPYSTGPGALDNPNFELSAMTAPLAAHRKDLLFLEGIDNSTGEHPAFYCTLTGQSGGDATTDISIDQVIAKKIGGATKYPSLQFATQAVRSLSFAAPKQNLPNMMLPSETWKRLFSGLEGNGDSLARLQAQEQSVLDAAVGQVKALESKVSQADRAKLEQYLTSFREVETRLSKLGSVTCSRPPKPNVNEEIDEHGRNELLPVHSKLQLDMFAMALACDLTRVASYQLTFEANNFKFPWLGITTRWHDMSHYEVTPANFRMHTKSTNEYIAMSKWTMEELAYCIEALRKFDLLTNTTMLWFTPMDHGGQHSTRIIPMLLIGSAGGKLKTGRHLRLPWSGTSSRRVNDVHLTLARAYGINDLATFGDPRLCKGPITELLA